MDDVVLVRHGESEAATAGTVGGDPPLTARGRAEAAELGAQLAALPIDLCITSAALRTAQTADIALAGRRDVPREVLVELGDVDFGSFAGRPLREYRDWIESHAPTDAPAGGESRVATLRRFCRVYGALLARSEAHLLVVAHGLTISALTDETPRPVVAGVPYGSWVRLRRDELETAVARLERWCEAPSW